MSVVLLYAAGVLAGRFWAPPLEWLFMASALALFICLFHRCRDRKWLALALLLTGCANITLQTMVLSPHDLRRLIGERAEYVTVRGRLVASPEERGDENGKDAPRTLAVIEALSLAGENYQGPAVGRVLIRTPGRLGPEYFQGRRVSIRGVLIEPEAAHARELFDYRKFLAGRGIYYELRCDSTHEWRLEPCDADPTGPPISDRFQHWARAALSNGLPVHDGVVRLLWAMMLGRRGGLDDDVADVFRHSGTMHIFAISGLHIGLITVILVGLCRAARLPRGLCGIVVIPALWFYAAATGWQASAIRATLMSTLLLSGWSLRRPLDLLNSLAGAAWLILLWDPSQLFQVGFQLSFSVVLSILLMLPHLSRFQDRFLQPDPLLPNELRSTWQQWRQRAIRNITGSAGISLAAMLGAIPWMAFYFNICTPISLLANLAVVPLAAVTLMSGLGSLITAAWCPYASVLYNHSAWLAMIGMITVSRWCAEIPWGWFYVTSPPVVAMIGYYTVLIASGVNQHPFASRTRLCAIGTGVSLLTGSLIASSQRAGMQLTVLPLRGGDSLFVESSGPRRVLLVDTGDANTAKYLVEPFLRARGVNRLPTLLLTHGDVRHVGGARAIRDEFRPRMTITSRSRSRSPAYRDLIRELEHAPESWHEVERGDEVCGWLVLHPAATDQFSRADDNALVLSGEFEGVRVLLCSDLSRLGQRTLSDREPDLRPDLIVAGMPNPDEPLSTGFLRRLDPALVIVSAGEYPASERPSRELRARLRALSVPVLFTCDHGAIYVTLRNGRWEVRAHDGWQWVDKSVSR